jgi:hypothetical protein
MRLIYVTENRDLLTRIYEHHIRRGYHKHSRFFAICLLVFLAFPVIFFGTAYLVLTITEAIRFGNLILKSLSVFCFSALFMIVLSRKVMAEYQNKPTFDNSYDTALYDYAWNTKGYTPKRQKKTFKSVVQSFLSIAFTTFSVVLTASAWIHSHIKAGVWGFIISALLIFITFNLCSETIKRIGRLIKYRDSRLVFDNFPYPHYEPVTIKWLAPQGLQEVNAGEFTLRCLREDYYMVGKSERVTHLEMWRGTWQLDEAYLFSTNKIHNFYYELPRCSPITELNSDKPTYWEFQVKLETADIDFVETYLVPIY